MGAKNYKHLKYLDHSPKNRFSAIQKNMGCYYVSMKPVKKTIINRILFVKHLFLLRLTTISFFMFSIILSLSYTV